MSSDLREADRPAVAARQRVLARLRALSTEIDRLDQVAADHYGLNRTDMHALDLITQERRISPTALAHHLGLTTGGTTTVLDRLERAGYIRRLPDPVDRRRLVVEKTDATADRDREVFGGLVALTLELLATYSGAELATLERFLDRMGEITAAHADRLKHAPPGRPEVRSPGET